MFVFAQTNLQLYRQLESLGYSRVERERVAQAYRFSSKLFSGLYRGSEKPFIAHLVGTASILAVHKVSIDLVLTGLLHAAYLVGDFGFDSGTRQSKRKRAYIRNLVGDDVEAMVAGYDDLLWNACVIKEYVLKTEALPPLTKSLLIVRLANTLEDQLDGGLLYCGGSKLREVSSDKTQQDMMQLATVLALPELAIQLKEEFERLNRGETAITCEDAMGHQSVLLLPHSVWRSPWAVMSGWVRRRFRRLNASPYFGRSAMIKNVFDRVFSVTALIMLSPVFCVIALGIKLESPGPVLFRQCRHGLDNTEIEIFKFRTMKHSSCNGEARQAVRDDARVTRLGQLLRKTSMDELPQFINVLRGDMSVVGPRPHPIALNQRFMTQIDQYMERHEVKPGITGWAQIHGLRGETDTLEKMKKRVEYDLYYIRHRSLWLDIKIVFRTAIGGWMGRNAL